ncbi:MAG: UDP-N-acetylglucosamine--N-acetylmuramyl-(pentapeptide) pyrophosphoryl-undecaprenol [Acidobacteriales bacterium]|nr:UDP-N-acetylglucosamine--N-acetylmuramyl-(pentapeptide) pyrophosphoryl-undecaprenol [Terriglobales bacterium]
MRVIIAGGGTGGHVIPALAIARELQSLYSAEVQFIGTARGIENRLVPQAGFELKLVKIGALKNVNLVTRARTLTDLPLAILAAGKILKTFRPDVVVGVGGYASGPAMLAAVLRGLPTVAFEPNVVPGFANRAVACFVTAAAVHFQETAKYFRNAQVTGVPVRKEFFAITTNNNSHPPTLLITGGSQGARALNRAVSAALPQLQQRTPGLHIVHQTGERDYNEVRAAYDSAGMTSNSEVSPFIDSMPAAFARADLLLCRSGASTVAEITAAGKVAVFVPFPHAADDHQRRNAEALSSRNAAMLIPETELTTDRLVEAIASLLNDPARLQQMSSVSRSLAHPIAAAEIAAMIARVSRNEKRETRN